MAQADYVVANGTGAAVRSDLNGQLAAIVSNNSGATEPATMYAYQWWADTTTGLLKLRNAANSAWVTVGTLADANLGLLSIAGGTLTGALLADDAGTAALPAIAFDGDPDTGAFRAGANEFGIATNGVERVEFGTSEVVFNDGGANYDFRIEGDTNANLFFVDASAEAVGIGTASPQRNAHFNSSTTEVALKLTNSTSGSGTGDGTDIKYEGLNLTINNREAGAINFETSNSLAATIDSSGRLLVGTSTAVNDFDGNTITPQIQFEGTSLNTSSLGTVRNSADTGGPKICFGKSRSASVNGRTIVQSGDNLGEITFEGANGTDFIRAASINVDLDGTPGVSDMPGRIVLATTANGASSPTERMRIHNHGSIGFNTTGDSIDATATSRFVYNKSSGFTAIQNTATTVLYVGRNTNDGTLVEFRQSNVAEGTISVSGTTVSYNGAHLSRWSQLPSGAERTEILRGSVLSNIDEMCEWGEEDNEQLNRMKVSDVEGDKNVSGVFQAWDDDDDTYTNDFYCAMTGDFIIRIAEGVTVERGDLLMSAGDGTAKPQDDDIIRSKTIAKVTSTNVSCTYEDGSYCVPCVLMAC
jgi:hypothetical protein